MIPSFSLFLKVKTMIYKSKIILAAALCLAAAPLLAQPFVAVTGNVGDVTFPAREHSHLNKGNKGDFVNVDNLRQMKRGLSKGEVRLLLGNPHFSEGLGGVSAWNYVFNFRTGNGEEYITCQYQVQYAKDPKYVVDSLHWDGPDCMNLLNRHEEVTAAPPPPAPRIVNLSADALFRFNQSGAADVLPQGTEEIAALARELQNQQNLAVTVIGHTDLLGSDSYNFGLSQARAETVRQLLIDDGVAASAIRAIGAGESQPVKRCEETAPRAALIECLQPNRRVEIQIVATASK